MTEMDELEILARFDRQLAAIEFEVPDPPGWSARRVRGSIRAVGWTFLEAEFMGEERAEGFVRAPSRPSW